MDKVRSTAASLVILALVVVGLAACEPPDFEHQWSGEVHTTHDGQVLEDFHLRGRLIIDHDFVRVRNFKITEPGWMAIEVNPETVGTIIESGDDPLTPQPEGWCELDGTGDTGSMPAVGYARYTIRDCDIHHFGEGPMANGDVLIEDSRLHHFVSYSHLGAHQDGVQVVCNDNITIRRNVIAMNVDDANAAIMVGTACGPVDNVNIIGNFLAGGGYTVYGGSDQNWPGPNATNVTIADNLFSTAYHPKGGYHGPLTNVWQVDVHGNEWCDDSFLLGCDGPNAGQPIG